MFYRELKNDAESIRPQMLRRTFVRGALFGALTLILIAIYVFIYRMSDTTGDISGALSARVTRLFISPSNPRFDTAHHLVRKCAHVTEFTALFTAWTLWMYCLFPRRDRVFRIILFSAAITLLSAAADEYHQLFTPGRSGQLTDILIDMTGVLCFLLLVALRPGAFREKREDKRKELGPGKQ